MTRTCRAAACGSARLATLRHQLSDRRARSVLSSLMRYCSARRIAPEAVDEAVLDGYMRYRAETTALASNAAARRAIARAWNGCVDRIEGWPAPRWSSRRSKPRRGRPGTTSAKAAERRRGLSQLAYPHQARRQRQAHPAVQPSTIRRCRAELIAAARMALREGVPIANLTSIADLLHPDVAERVIDAYWKADGAEPRTYTIDLGWKLLSIARQIGCLDEGALERLDDMRASLEFYRRGGLTEKPRRHPPGAERRCLARGGQASGSLDDAGAVVARAGTGQGRGDRQLAVAIGILIFARCLWQSGTDRLDQNLIKPGGRNAPYMLVFPDYDVKNRVNLEFPFDDELTTLIDEYVHQFRSILLRESNELWLFPGESGGCKDAKTFSGQISERVEKATGLRITVHQFRHAAAAMWLKHNPGDYETVRRMLGTATSRPRSISTAGSRPCRRT